MKQILILTHGKFAMGIQDSLTMIAGTLDYVKTLCIQDEDTPDTIENNIQEFINIGESSDPHIIITDIPGGSSTRMALPFVKQQDHVHVVTGLNLALLLEIVLNPNEDNIEEQLKKAIESAKTSMLYLNDMMNSVDQKED